uniref:Sulfotransferase domain-containing protein n=1 Tax=Calcidiscus leptoporus TaxID=127549 RepID=A0A7S0NSV0_9EUKA
MARMAEYYRLMADYVPADSRVARCLKSQQRATPPYPLSADGILMAMGVEGSGHHVLERGINRSLCHAETSKYRCGRQASFPAGFKWRKDSTLDPAQFMPAKRYCTPRVPANHTFLVLLRNPVDTFSSAFGRFFPMAQYRQLGAAAENDTLAHELDAHYQGWLEVATCTSKLPCNRMWFLAYELLFSAPRAHVPMLEALFDVSEGNPHIEHFVRPFEKLVAARPAAEAQLQWDSLSKSQRMLVGKLRKLTELWSEAGLTWARPSWSYLPAAETEWPLVPQLEMPVWVSHCSLAELNASRAGAEGENGTRHTLRLDPKVSCLLAWRNATARWFYDASRSLDIFPPPPSDVGSSGRSSRDLLV